MVHVVVTLTVVALIAWAYHSSIRQQERHHKAKVARLSDEVEYYRERAKNLEIAQHRDKPRSVFLQDLLARNKEKQRRIECLIQDLNIDIIRARLPELTPDTAGAAVALEIIRDSEIDAPVFYGVSIGTAIDLVMKHVAFIGEHADFDFRPRGVSAACDDVEEVIVGRPLWPEHQLHPEILGRWEDNPTLDLSGPSAMDSDRICTAQGDGRRN